MAKETNKSSSSSTDDNDVVMNESERDLSNEAASSVPNVDKVSSGEKGMTSSLDENKGPSRLGVQLVLKVATHGMKSWEKLQSLSGDEQKKWVYDQWVIEERAKRAVVEHLLNQGASATQYGRGTMNNIIGTKVDKKTLKNPLPTTGGVMNENARIPRLAEEWKVLTSTLTSWKE